MIWQFICEEIKKAIKIGNIYDTYKTINRLTEEEIHINMLNIDIYVQEHSTLITREDRKFIYFN